MTWIPQKELAEITGLSRSALAEWARRPGCPKRTVAGQTEYEWPAWNEWRFEEGRRARLTPDLTDARARKMDAEAKLAEMELARLEGITVTVEEAGQVLDRMLDAMRAVLLSFTRRNAHKLVGLKSIPEVSTVLDAAVYELMATLVVTGNEPVEGPDDA